jgi:MoxR-like ATPase
MATTPRTTTTTTTSGWLLETARRAADGQAVVVGLTVHDRALVAGRLMAATPALATTFGAFGYRHVVVFDAVRGGHSLQEPPEELRDLLDDVIGDADPLPPGDAASLPFDDDPDVTNRFEMLEESIRPRSTQGELAAEDPNTMLEQAALLLGESTLPIAVVIDDAHLMLGDRSDPGTRRAIARLRRCVEGRRLHPAAPGAPGDQPLRNALAIVHAGPQPPALELLPHAQLRRVDVGSADLDERRGGWIASFAEVGLGAPDDDEADLWAQVGDVPHAEMSAVLVDGRRHRLDLADAPEALRRYHRGPQPRGWEMLGPELVDRVRREAGKALIGQDHAIERMVDRIVEGIYGPRTPGEPVAVLVFSGPSGTGKTLLSRVIAKSILGDERNLIRYDMNAFADESSVRRFIGAEPGYIGYERGGQLVNDLLAHPSCVVLFDEFDKAPPEISRVMLQLIEEGRISDGLGRTADASGAVLVFATNFGVDGAPVGLSPEEASHYYEEAIVEHFNPAVPREDGQSSVGKPFMGRLLDIGEVVGFRPITPEMMQAVAEQAAREQERSFQQRGVAVTIDAEAVGALAAANVPPGRELEDYGARAVRRQVRPIVAAVAHHRLARFGDDGPLHLTVVDSRPVVQEPT